MFLTLILAQIFQYGTIESVGNRKYDGDMTYKEVMTKGNFGLGTFNGFDGEMIALDGKFYHLDPSGKVSEVSPDDMTPYVTVTDFRADASYPFTNVENRTLSGLLYPKLKNPTRPHAIMIKGTFSYVKVRNFQKQRKPYRSFEEIVQEQKSITKNNVTGVLVGFYYPQFMDNINFENYHFHFLNDDHSFGGHVLDVTPTKGTVYVQESQETTVNFGP